MILSLAYSPGHLYHLFFVTGPIFYARLRHEKDDKKVLAMIDKIDSGPWTVYEPWFEYCFPEWVHPEDQWLVGKYGEDTAEHASATGLQGPRQAGNLTTGILQEKSAVLIWICLVSHSGSANSSYPAEERQNVFFTESGILMNQHQ